MAAKAKTDAAGVRFNEEADSYELGAEVDGTFVPFYTLPGSSVRSTVEAAKNVAQAEPQPAGQ